MNILAVIGTPTKEEGYTTRTVDALADSLQQLGGVRVEYLFLEDLNLSRCQGHLTCIKQGESACPFSPDISALTERFNQADGIIFASPVHCFNVSTLMKNMIDLYVYQMHRPSFFGKPAVVVTSAAGAGQKGVLKYLRNTFATWGFNVVGKLGTHSGLFDEPPYKPKLKAAADKVTQQLLDAIARQEVPQPGVAELISFRVWRSVVNRTKDASPYDWNHWHEAGWFEQDYYFPVKPNPFAKALAGFVEGMIERTIKKVSVKPVT